MKKLSIILFLSVSTPIFSQGNFTTEWQSPAGWDGGILLKLNTNSNIYHLAFKQNSDPRNVRLYNSATHNADYSWTWNNANFWFRGIEGIDYGSRIFDDKFDPTGDGISEVILDDFANGYKIINPTNGQLIFSAPGGISAICDVDNDGYLELVVGSGDSTSPGIIKIISTPAQTVSVNNQTEIVKDYELKQNYPNPFNPNTTIEYSLNKNSDVKIIIYDILGKEVNTLVNQKQVSGTYKLNLNAGELSSGTYFYSLIVDGVVDSKKMILIK